MSQVICTSRDGDRFWKLNECYIRGNSIKYLRIPEEVIDQVVEEEVKPSARGAGVMKGRLATGAKKPAGKGGKGKSEGGKGEGGKGGGGKGGRGGDGKGGKGKGGRGI